VPAVLGPDGVAARHLAVPPVQVQARMLRGRAADGRLRDGLTQNLHAEAAQGTSVRRPCVRLQYRP
jgi:hypothetical protein